ncbi:MULTISPECIES: hypothetical protein [unclassified Myroides]|uniref:hypothetical protein n=1 Tax=unclassified Myroides TaxID=2642485 RepID=UPI003D2F6286
MKYNYIYSLLLLFLCFGFQAQAQRVVAYQTKLSELSSTQVSAWKIELEGDYDQKYINFRDLENAEQVFEEIEIIDLKWDGQSVLTLPTAAVNRLQSLRLIYLRSNQVLNDNVIKQRFRQLIQQVERLDQDVEIVYRTMEKPN